MLSGRLAALIVTGLWPIAGWGANDSPLGPEVSGNPAPTLAAPIGFDRVASVTPTFRWTDTSSTLYHIKVWNVSGVVEDRDVDTSACSGGDCETTALSPLPLDLHAWEVSASNDDGATWTAPGLVNRALFYVQGPTPSSAELPQPPATFPDQIDQLAPEFYWEDPYLDYDRADQHSRAYTYSPQGLTKSTVPIFTWPATDNATSYQLYIEGENAGYSRWDTVFWYEGVVAPVGYRSNLSGRGCFSVLPDTLSAGNYCWWVKPNIEGQSTAWSECRVMTVSTGLPGGDETIALYGLDNKLFRLFDDNIGGSSYVDYQFKQSVSQKSASIPFSGDFDGDGFDELGILTKDRFYFGVENPATQTYIDWLPVETIFGIPVAGDFDGDDIDGYGFFDPDSGIMYFREPTADYQIDVADIISPTSFVAKKFGVVLGDFDGDGVDTVGVLNLLTGEFKFTNSQTPSGADGSYSFSSPEIPGVLGMTTGNVDGVAGDELIIFDSRQYVAYVVDLQLASPRIVQFFQLPRTNWDSIPLFGNWGSVTTNTTGTGYAWPTSTPAAEGIPDSSIFLARLIADAIPNLRSLLIFKNDKLVSESYFGGAYAGLLNPIASVSKSFTSTLMGIAKKDLLWQDHAETAYSHDPSLFDDPFHPVTDPYIRNVSLYDLLTMQAGLQWEDPEDNPMMAQSGMDWDLYYVTRPFLMDGAQRIYPGTRFHYASGNTNVLCRLLQRMLDPYSLTLDQYAQAKLFYPLGITEYTWDYSPSGIPQGGGAIRMKPRDMARLGHLYLHGGTFPGQSPIIESAYASTATSALATMPSWESTRDYGYQWWLLPFGTSNSVPHSRYASYHALGWGGQTVVVIPGVDMVVVTTAKSNVKVFSENELTQLIYFMIETLMTYI